MQLVIRWSPPVWPFGSFRVRSPFERLHCMLLGHDSVLDVERRSIALRCRRCTWRSPGWQLDLPGKQPFRDRAAPATASLTPSLCGPRSTR